MDNLPCEIYLEITEYISVRDWVSLHATCKYFIFMEKYQYVCHDDNQVCAYNAHGVCISYIRNHASARKGIRYVKYDLGVIVEQFYIDGDIVQVNNTIYNNFPIDIAWNYFHAEYRKCIYKYERHLRQITVKPFGYAGNATEYIRSDTPRVSSPLFLQHMCRLCLTGCYICCAIYFATGQTAYCTICHDLGCRRHASKHFLSWIDRDIVLTHTAVYCKPLHAILIMIT
jgi:hypothetical protein